MERHLGKRLSWRSWGNKTRNEGDALARSRWYERQIWMQTREERQKTASVRAPQETHFEARTWGAGLGCLSQIQFSKCVSAKLLEDSGGVKMREIPEKETIWNLGCIPQSESHASLWRSQVLLTLRAVGWPCSPQRSKGLPQELSMHSGNKQVGN